MLLAVSLAGVGDAQGVLATSTTLLAADGNAVPVVGSAANEGDIGVIRLPDIPQARRSWQRGLRDGIGESRRVFRLSSGSPDHPAGEPRARGRGRIVRVVVPARSKIGRRCGGGHESPGRRGIKNKIPYQSNDLIISFTFQNVNLNNKLLTQSQPRSTRERTVKYKILKNV